MKKIYFTFGSDEKYPYGRENYIVAIGVDEQDCFDAFKKKYPNRKGSTALNCADFYMESKWERIQKEYYLDKAPAEILISDKAYGEKPEGFAPVWFFVPEKETLIFLQEGSGDNLTSEDREAGNVDYVDYAEFVIGYGEVVEDDGGMLMFPYMVQEHYKCLADAIPDVLADIYGDAFMDAQILKRAKGD